VPQLLLEILSEEIPARMQAEGRGGSRQGVDGWLPAAGLSSWRESRDFRARCRLVAVVEGLPVKSADVVEVCDRAEGGRAAARRRRLPAEGGDSPRWSRGARHLHEVPKKGVVYVAHVRKPGEQTADVIASPSCRRSSGVPLAEIDALGVSAAICAGCARSAASSARSMARSCRSTIEGVRSRTTMSPRAIASMGRRAVQGAPVRRPCRRAEEQGPRDPRPRGAERDDPHRREAAARGAEPRAGR